MTESSYSFLRNNLFFADRATFALFESRFGAGCFPCRINNLGMMTDSLDYFLGVVIAVFAVIVGLIAVLKAGCSFFRNMRQVMIFLFA